MDIPRRILDKGSRLFLLRDAAETDSGYEYITVTGSAYKGELLRGWYFGRNEFGQYVLEIACHKNPLTEDDLRQIDAVGYLTQGEAYMLIFEVSQADLPRISADMYAKFNMDATNIRQAPETV